MLYYLKKKKLWESVCRSSTPAIAAGVIVRMQEAKASPEMV